MTAKSLVKLTESEDLANGSAKAKTERDFEKCEYCRKSLPKLHYISVYEGHYCNEDCHRMYTED